MTCPKCQGLMIRELGRDEEAGLVSDQWRCLNCGLIEPDGQPAALVGPSRPAGPPAASPPRDNKYLVQNFSTKVAPAESGARKFLRNSSYEHSDREEKVAAQRRYGRAYFWRSRGYTEAEVVALERAYQVRGGKKAGWGESKRGVGRG